MAGPEYQLAISAIAWEYSQDINVAALMEKSGVSAVELAPTKIWPEKIAADPLQITDTEIKEVLERWGGYGIRPVAMQSMLFLRPEMTIFQNEEERNKTLSYLKAFIVLAGRLGITRMVFGSPKNRRVPEGLTEKEAWAIAVEFFRELGVEALRHDVVFCIEPNPEVYNCNFVTNALSGARLVRDAGEPGFGLHLDAAGMTLAGDTAKDILDNIDILKHFHISAPYLGKITDDTTIPHVSFAHALRSIKYDQTVSIEMRPGANDEENLANVTDAIIRARADYFSI